MNHLHVQTEPVPRRMRATLTETEPVLFDVNYQASELFAQLGMDMSSAMNIFLRQCVLRGGFPFSVELPQYKPEIIEEI